MLIARKERQKYTWKWRPLVVEGPSQQSGCCTNQSLTRTRTFILTEHKTYINMHNRFFIESTDRLKIS